MKIRRYLGTNTQEAILKVKMDLGNEAMILNTRKVRQKGLMKIFAKPMVEVLAAVDEDYENRKDKKQQKQTEKKTILEKAALQINGVSEEKEEKITELENKVSSMETLLQRIYDRMQVGTQRNASVNSLEDNETYPKVLQLFYNNLVKNEVEEDIAKKIIDTVNTKVGQNANVNDTAALIYSMISGVLGKPETIKLREDGKPTVVIFIGPTGVGKTTTLAKIAANYSLNHKKNVGLITADTYRIAAVEQLKTYAEILGMPVSVAYSANEIKEAIDLYSDKDLILIDTAGRSIKNKTQFDELKTLVMASDADEIYLVLSTTSSVRSCKEIISHYNFIDRYKLIFTKLDETPISGVILNIKYMTDQSLSYITTGQSVPDDIEVANIDKIAKNLLGSLR